MKCRGDTLRKAWDWDVFCAIVVTSGSRRALTDDCGIVTRRCHTFLAGSVDFDRLSDGVFVLTPYAAEATP